MFYDKSTDRVFFGVSGEPNPDTFSYLIQIFLTIIQRLRAGKWSYINYSHCASGFYSVDAEEFIISDASSSCQNDTLEQFLDNGKTVIRHAWAVKVTPGERVNFCKKMFELSGTKYSSIRGLIWLVISATLRISWSPLKESSKRPYCNQYTDDLLAAVNLPNTCKVFPELRRHQTTPWDFVRTMEQLQKRFPDRIEKVR